MENVKMLLDSITYGFVEVLRISSDGLHYTIHIFPNRFSLAVRPGSSLRDQPLVSTHSSASLVARPSILACIRSCTLLVVHTLSPLAHLFYSIFEALRLAACLAFVPRCEPTVPSKLPETFAPSFGLAFLHPVVPLRLRHRVTVD
ncbi:hypothetical protein Tcan_00584, partial [Toxocara canis]